ncbi:MAG: hypothetical protein ABIR39_04690 [Nocardioides sp.]|uniref:hypothetical protein n=1 Tax=Nocardioides sp. TaxID=35761 RepID=UPI003267B2A1
MSRWTLAATVVLVGGLLAGCGSAADPEAGEGASTTTEPTTLELTVPAEAAGRCMPPNVDNLQAQDTAFEGVVTAVADGTATLDVTESLKGADGVGTATVAAPDADLQALLIAVDFQQGETYLVSSLDGEVSVCGLSGPKDDLLTGLYAEAYSG